MKPKFTFVIAVAVIVFGYLYAATDTAFGQVVVQAPGTTVCIGGNCYAPVPVYSPPQRIMVPRVQYQPYQYQGSAIVERRYHTPIRNWFFGRYRGYHYYAPVQR